MTQYYASPTGTGNGLAVGTPFQIADFWAVGGPGDTLNLLNGTYTGVDSMIDPPDGGISGSSGNPITIKAINEGQVLINGQFLRRPLRLRNNDWFIIENINCANSSNSVVTLAAGCADSIVRRVCAWDCNTGGNNQVFEIVGTRLLIEDCVGLGTGRKMFGRFKGVDVTFRRCFGMKTLQPENDPGAVITIAYDSTRPITENCIACEDFSTLPSSANEVLVGPDHYNNTSLTGPQTVKMLGCISYRFNAQTTKLAWMTNPNFNPANVDPEVSVHAVWEDIVALRRTAATPATGIQFFADGSNTSMEGTYRTDSVGTLAGGTHTTENGNKTQGQFAGSGLLQIAATTRPAFGAWLRYRYVNGVLTGDPLWPWPMRQRLIDALVASGHDDVGLDGSGETDIHVVLSAMTGDTIPEGGGPVETTYRINPFSWEDPYTPPRKPEIIVLPLTAIALDVGYAYHPSVWHETYTGAPDRDTLTPVTLFAFDALEHSAPHLDRTWVMQDVWWPFARHYGSAEVMPTFAGMGIFLAIDALGTLYLTDSQPPGSGTSALMQLRDSVTGVLGEIAGAIAAESSQITITNLPNPPGLPGTPLVVLDPEYPAKYLVLYDTGGMPWYLWNLEGAFLVQDTPPEHYQDATPPGGPYTWWELPMLSGEFAAVSITPLGDITISDTPPAGEGLADTAVLGDAYGVLWHFGVTLDYNLAMSNAVAVDFAQMATCLVFSDQAHGRWFVRIAEDQGIIMSRVLEPETLPWQAVGELGWIRVQDPLGGLDWYVSMDPSQSLIAQHAPPLGTPPGLEAAQALLRDKEGLWWKFVVTVDGGIGLEPQPPEVIPLAQPIIAVADCLEALRHVEAAGAITTLWVT